MRFRQHKSINTLFMNIQFRAQVFNTKLFVSFGANGKLLGSALILGTEISSMLRLDFSSEITIVIPYKSRLTYF